MDRGSVDHGQPLLVDLFETPSVPDAGKRLLRTAEVARLFEVSGRTISEWARRGRIPSVRTPGGHRRYPADLIMSMVQGQHDRSGTTRVVHPQVAQLTTKEGYRPSLTFVERRA